MAEHLRCDLTFNRAVYLPGLPPTDALVQRNLFRAHFNTNMFRRLGAEPADSFVPSQLRPTNIVEQEVARRLRAAGYPVRGVRMPLAIICDGKPSRLAVATRLFPPHILGITVTVASLTIDPTNLVSELISAQRGLPPGLLAEIQRIAAVIVTTGRHTVATDAAPQLNGVTLPAMHLHVPVETHAIADWGDMHWAELSAAVIRDTDYQTSSPRIAERLRQRNAEVNLKGGIRRLIDKQGALLVSSEEDRARGNIEFKRLGDLQAMALIFRSFLWMYERDRSDDADLFDYLLSKATRWVTAPERVLRQSVTSQHAWRLSAAEMKLPEDVADLLDHEATRGRLASIRDETRRIDGRWWLHPDLRAELARALAAQPGTLSWSPTQVVNIAHAASIQIAAGDIATYGTHIEFSAAVDEAIDALDEVDEVTKAEAKTLWQKLRATGDTVATSAAGGAGGAVLAAVLQRLLGLH